MRLGLKFKGTRQARLEKRTKLAVDTVLGDFEKKWGHKKLEQALKNLDPVKGSIKSKKRLGLRV